MRTAIRSKRVNLRANLPVNLEEEDVVSSTMSYIEGSLEQMHASMHADVVAGRPLELEALNGAVVRAGRMAQVPTPVNNLIYAMVKPFKDGHSEQAR